MKKYAFVNVDLSAHQQIRYEEYSIHEDDWPNLIEDLVMTGYKVSISSNLENGGVLVSITDRRKKTKNADKVLTSWGGSIKSSFQQAAVYLNLALDRAKSWDELKGVLAKESDEDLRAYKEYLDKKRSGSNSTGS